MQQEVEIISDSLFLVQRRLFTQLNLCDVLSARRDLAVSQFKRGLRDGKVDQLIERIYDRFESIPLWLDDQIIPGRVWDRGDGSNEAEFSVPFGGDAIFWDCSPVPVDDKLPRGCSFSEWFLDPGETLQHPHGEVFRNRLILIASDVTKDCLEPYREILREQERQVDQANKELLAELHLLGYSAGGKALN